MAARSRADSGVNERRLRPVYDCLDNGNNKKALQEAEKVLRKQKDFQCAKVLKALALLRLGRNDDSTKLLRDVENEVPTDDATLQAITICYGELQKPDSIARVYEAAMQKEPTNEELLTHLFMAYVRIGEYKKQQQMAMSLYKLFDRLI